MDYKDKQKLSKVGVVGIVILDDQHIGWGLSHKSLRSAAASSSCNPFSIDPCRHRDSLERSLLHSHFLLLQVTLPNTAHSFITDCRQQHFAALQFFGRLIMCKFRADLKLPLGYIDCIVLAVQKDEVLLLLKLFVCGQHLQHSQWSLLFSVLLEGFDPSVDVLFIKHDFRVELAADSSLPFPGRWQILLLCAFNPHPSSQLYYQIILHKENKRAQLFLASLHLLFKVTYFFQNKDHMQSNTQSFSQPRIEDSILFDVNQQTLLDMNLTQHISRLQQMSRFLGDALNKNRSNLLDLRELVKSQIANLKNNTQILQSNIRDETAQLKSLFEPTIAAEIKKINELKTDVGKINAEQLTTKKFLLNLEASISHCETEIGFREYKR